jgi:hypothetical protein
MLEAKEWAEAINSARDHAARVADDDERADEANERFMRLQDTHNRRIEEIRGR